MAKRCIWSNKTGDDLVEVDLSEDGNSGLGVGAGKYYVFPKYEKNVKEFYEYVRKFRILFFILTGISLVFPLLMMNLTGSGILLISLGIVIIIFPFATPQTFEMLGIKKTIFVVRFLGVMIIFTGLSFMILL